jgi:hypothetical protein
MVEESWRTRFELGSKPQTAIADKAAALPLVVAKRFESNFGVDSGL